MKISPHFSTVKSDDDITDIRNTHRNEKIGGCHNLSKADEDAVIEKFKASSESLSQNEMDVLMNRFCRTYESEVHISMLVLSSTMIVDQDESKDGFRARMSNIRANHNNHTQVVALEMINNMARNPLKIKDKNNNDSKSWGSDVIAYVTKWDMVSATKIEKRILGNFTWFPRKMKF